MNFESPEMHVEKIIAAAVLFDHKVYTGTSHFAIVDKMNQTLPGWTEEKEKGDPEGGFMTSNGRFVSREDAGRIAKRAGQLDHLEDGKRVSAALGLRSQDIQGLNDEE